MIKTLTLPRPHRGACSLRAVLRRLAGAALSLFLALAAALPMIAQSGGCFQIRSFGTIDGETMYCSGETVTLRVDVNFGSDANLFAYEWIHKGQNVAQTRSNTFRINSLTASDAGAWRVRVTVFCEEFDLSIVESRPLTLGITPSPPATIAADPGKVLDCERPDTRLSVPEAPASATFRWEGPGISSTARQVRVERGGTFLVTVTDQGCSNEGFIEITDNTPYQPSANAGEDIVLQQCGQNVQLDAGGSGNGGKGSLRYEWSGPGFSYTGNNTRVQVPNAQPGVYTLTVVNTLSRCTASDAVTLDGSNLSLPEVDAGDPQTLTCRDNTVTVGGPGSAAGPDITYRWRAREGGRIVEGQRLAQAVVDRPGRYELTVENTATRCRQSASVVVDENRQAPEVSIEPTGQLFYCSGESLTLEAIGDADTWSWSTGDQGQRLEVSDPGLYLLEGERADNGCVGMAEANVTERPKPELPLPEDDLLAAPGEAVSIPLSPTPPDARSLWAIEGLDHIDEATSVFAPQGEELITGTFFPRSDRAVARVTYLAYAERNGCSSDTGQIRLVLRSDGAELFIPDVFTPNGDGVNDEWQILLPEGGSPDDYTLTVYDRRGRRIHEQADLSTPWDGSGAAEGIYYYVIEPHGNGQPLRGAVAIVGTDHP